MSIRRSSIDRLNEARKSSLPTIGRGKPLNSQGNEGDLTFRRTSDGLMLYIKANHSWHGVKVGESFSSLEKVINDVKSKVDVMKQFRLPSTYSVTGDFTLDVSGDITLDADGGKVHIKDAGTSHFLFDCDNTTFAIYDDANASDYCRLIVDTNGATTLNTVDADATLAHFTIDADGYITLDSANTSGYTNFAQNGTTFARFESHHSNSYLTLFENSGASDDDYFQIACAANGETTISTIDQAGADAHLKFEPDGSLLVKEVASAGGDVAGYGQIWVKNSTPNELYFTTDAGNDIQLTSGTSVAGGGTVYHYQMHQFYASATTDVYVPFGASAVEGSSTSTSMIDDTYWIAPYAGKLVKVYLYSRTGPDETDLKLRINGTLGSSLLSGGAVDADNGSTVYSFDCDQNNTFSAGDVINLYIDITTAPYQVTMTSVWEID